MKLANKISLLFSVTCLASMAVIFSIIYTITRVNIQRTIVEDLQSIARSSANHVETYLRMTKISVGQLSRSATLEDFLKLNGTENPLRNEAFKAAMKRLKRTEEANLSVYEFLLMDKAGKVVASGRENDIGSDKSMDVLFLGGQNEIFIKDAYYLESLKEPFIGVSAPCFDSITGEFLGVLAARFKMNDLNDILLDKTGLGKAGEIYIVNKYGYMITDSRFIKDTFLKQKVDTVNVRSARLHQDKGCNLSLEKHSLIFPNYLGVPVIGVHEFISKMGWILLAEVDIKEAFRPLVQVNIIFLLSFLIMAVTSWLLGMFFARFIVAPIHKLQDGVEKIGGGNLDYRINSKAKDEVGQLSRAFDIMAESLKRTTTSIEALNKEVIERKKAQGDLNQALKEKEKSHEILASMLADNNQIREKLEEHIGELKRTQEMLVQSEKLASLGKLVSEIAHEINNPLMIISGNAQLSLMLKPESDEVINNLKIIMDECQRAKAIIQRLLRFSRPSKGITKEVDINRSIETIVSILGNQFKLVNVEIKRDYMKDLPLILIDEQQIQEVFINLLNNAKDAMSSGGTISITTSLEGNFLRIDFKDTGSGISEKDKHSIFEPFFTTKEMGTGLGLAVCYGIVRAHDGELKFNSELNKGTTFTILLPLRGKA